MALTVSTSFASGTVSSVSGTTINLATGTAVAGWVGRLFRLNSNIANTPRAGQYREITAVNSTSQIVVKTTWQTAAVMGLTASYAAFAEAIDTATDQITISNHRFISTDYVGVYSTNTLPGGTSNTVLYYAKIVDSNTIQLCTDSALTSVVNLTSAGVGNVYILRDAFLEGLPQNTDAFHISHVLDDIDDGTNIQKVDTYLYRNLAGLTLSNNVTLYCKNLFFDLADCRIGGSAPFIVNADAAFICLEASIRISISTTGLQRCFNSSSTTVGDIVFEYCVLDPVIGSTVDMFNGFTRSVAQIFRLINTSVSGYFPFRYQGARSIALKSNVFDGLTAITSEVRSAFQFATPGAYFLDSSIVNTEQALNIYWPILTGNLAISGLKASTIDRFFATISNFSGGSTARTATIVDAEYDNSAPDFLNWVSVTTGGGTKTVLWAKSLTVTATVSGVVTGGFQFALFDVTATQFLNVASSTGTISAIYLTDRRFLEPAADGTVSFASGTQRAPYTGRFRQYGVRFLEQTFAAQAPERFNWYKQTNTFVTAANSAVALAVTNPSTCNQIYDKYQARYAQSGNMQYSEQITTNDGVTLVFDLNITLNSAATVDTPNFASNTAEFVNVTNGTFGTIRLAAGRRLTLGTYSSYADSSWAFPSTAIINVNAAPSTLDVSNWEFADGCSFEITDGGSITIIVANSDVAAQLEADKTETSGSITFSAPVASLAAANFEDDIRIYTARYQTFIINSADINTTTDQITLGPDSETGSSFAGQITTPATLAYLVAAPGATLPTSTPQIATNRLYYIVANSSGVVQISETEGGSAINFSSTGTESGGYLFSLTCSTELSNELISGGSGFSAAYTLPDGALIEVAAQGIAADESTATTLFHRIVEWSSTAGASIADTFSLTNNPDAIYGQLIGSTITSKRGVAITVTSEPSSVLGITFDLSGNIELDANAITDSTLYAPDAYVWSIYQRYTEDGIRFIRNQFEALSIMEFDFNGVLTIDNIADGVRNSPATPLIVLGNLYTSAESIYAANSGTIRVEPFFVSDLTSAGDGSFTSGDRTQLDELYATLESAGVFSEAALANAPAGGGGGIPDWTADEKSQIRYRLGIDGAEAAPSTNTPELGTIDANVVSFEVDAIDADAIASSAITEIQSGLSTFNPATTPVTAGTVTDKTGYSLTQSFPSNFSSLLINASGHVGRVTLVDTTTTNTDMRGTDNALLADNYAAPANSSIADILEDTGTTIPTTLAVIDALIDSIKAKTDQLTFTVANQVDANALTGGGGDDSATIYSYFTALSRADAFKADVSGLSTLTTSDIPTAASIAGAVQNELDDDFAALADILAGIPDDVAAQTAIAAMLSRIIKMAKARGLEPGVTASQLDPTDEAPGFLTTSDDAVDQTIIKNGDGSITISSN